MTMIPARLAIAAGLLLVASHGWAQQTGGTPAAGSFQSLSPGNQNIARSLFLAQHATSNGPAPLSLNQIAALKGREGWGQVFSQMKSDGLVDAKNLGQVVSGYQHQLHEPGATAALVHPTPGHASGLAAGGDHGGGELHADAAEAGDGHGANVTGIVSASQGGASSASAGSGAVHGTAAHGR